MNRQTIVPTRETLPVALTHCAQGRCRLLDLPSTTVVWAVRNPLAEQLAEEGKIRCLGRNGLVVKYAMDRGRAVVVTVSRRKQS